MASYQWYNKEGNRGDMRKNLRDMADFQGKRPSQ